MPESLPAFLAGTLETLQLTTAEPAPARRQRRLNLIDAGPVEIEEEGPVGGFAPKSNRLGMQIEIQNHSQWCWAAVSVSVAAFLDQSSNWTQCSLATQVKQVDCCEGYTDACDNGEVLSKPLKVVGVYGGFHSTALSYRQVKQTIEQSLPVCCFIDWHDGSVVGHFVVVGGWLEGDSGTVYLDVFDPSDGGVRQVVYDQFVQQGYRTGGSWTDSYLVKRPVPTV
jgi:hypothetical protein